MNENNDQKPENLACPICEGPMVSRLNKAENTRFWGCRNFPACRGTRDVDGLSSEDKRKAREKKAEEEEDAPKTIGFNRFVK